MPDDITYLERFRRRALGPEYFDHLGHLRIAWLHLVHFDEGEARRRVCTGIRELATQFGVPEKFNHTLTEALMRIIAQRMQGRATQSFDAFLCANPDLLNDAQALLARYYSDECLGSERARTGWVEPDREAIT